MKIVLSGLWISMLFAFAYVDIFTFWRADVINGALTGEVSGTDFEVNQAFLTLTTIYVLIPSLMVVVSLLTRPTVNRRINIVVSLLYVATVAASSIGEKWLYYFLGSVVEGDSFSPSHASRGNGPKHAPRSQPRTEDLFAVSLRRPHGSECDLLIWL